MKNSFGQMALGVAIFVLAQLSLYIAIEHRILPAGAEMPTSYRDPCGRKKPSTPVFNPERFRRCSDFYTDKLGVAEQTTADGSGNLLDEGKIFTVSGWRLSCVSKAAGGHDPEVLNDALACAENVYPGAELEKAVEAANAKRRENRK